jgi:hypothetical protein
MCAVVILAICFIAPRLAMRYASTAPIRHSAILSQICPISLLAFMLWVSADYGWRVDHGLTSPSDNPAWWSYLRPMLIVSMGTGMPAMMFFFLTSMAHKDTIAKSDGRRWNVGIIAVFSVGMTICAAIYLFTRYGH